jgi:hypothetical protein
MHTRAQFRLSASTILVTIASFSGAAQAHFNLIMPPPADSATDGGKGAPPCGPTTASGVVTAVQGGHPIAVSLNETVLHPGHYRIALSINSRSELPPDPVAVTDASGNSVSAPFEDPAVFPVLADDVFDHTTGTTPIPFSMQVMLPNVTCSKCTLQVIEFMAKHGPNPGGGFYYHHCADLAITADPSLPIFDPNATSGSGGATTGSGGATGTAGATGNTDGGSKAKDSGGGCMLAGRSTQALSGGTTTALLAFGLALAMRRRRR